ncbi:MAG: rhodanese-like domain-containing protein [Actinobacteria bacterium]|nr:rhodanese-like domain-containing protein [Actinomycetota bacterium]
MKNMIHRPAKWLALLACCSIVALVFFVAISSASPPAGDEQFGIIADNSNAFLNSNPSIYISSPALMALLDDNNNGVIGDAGDNPSNDPLVIDMRSWTDYQATPGTGMSHGHIPGAINLGMVNPAYTYKDIDQPDSLQFIRSELAKHANKTIVLACYSGHTDKLAEMALGSVAQAGYFGSPAPDIAALKWGNLEWNSAAEPSVLAEVTPGTKDIYVHTYGMETTPHPLPAPGAYPVINNTTSTEPAEITRAADDLSLHATNPPFIFPGTGTGQVNDSNIGNYTVVDVRSAADYAYGHITGAVNIPYQQLFAKDGGGNYTNLLSIDTSKPVIVYANGQQESNAAVIGLNALGIRNAGAPDQGLRYGLAAWNNSYGMEFNANTEEHNYPVVTGSAPGGVAYSLPRGNTDYVYYFPWYDTSNDGFGAGTWINIANDGASTATVSISLGGTFKTDFTLAAGAENNQIWSNYKGGPVEVRCVGCTTSGNHLTVAERALYNGTFNETIAPEHTEGGGASDLGTKYSFPWYDNKSDNMNGDWIVATNADPTNSATVDVYVGGVLKQTLGPIAPHATNTNPLQISPQMAGGPIRVVSRGGQPIVVSQRVLYGNSFNETFGRKLS